MTTVTLNFRDRARARFGLRTDAIFGAPVSVGLPQAPDRLKED